MYDVRCTMLDAIIGGQHVTSNIVHLTLYMFSKQFLSKNTPQYFSIFQNYPPPNKPLKELFHLQFLLLT